MNERDIDELRRRWREQAMSDERLLGMLPEDAARLLLDDVLARLDAAAASRGAAEFSTRAEAILASARATADAAAQADDPLAFVRTASRAATGGSDAPPQAGRTATRGQARPSRGGRSRRSAGGDDRTDA